MNDPATIKNLEVIFQNLIGIVLQLAGVAVFVMLVIGGFKYLTAGSDPKKVQSAQNTLTYAIGGMVLAILAWFIIFAIEKITNVKVTEFNIP